MNMNMNMKFFKSSLLFVMMLAFVLPLKSGNVISARTACPSSGASAVASTQTKVVWAAIQAPLGNAGTIYVGQSGVTSTTGVQIVAGGSVTLQAQGNAQAYDLSKTYFACSNSADVIVYVAAQ